MEIKIGERYKNRNGDVGVIIQYKFDKTGHFPFIFKSPGCHEYLVTTTGSRNLNQGSVLDLVEHIPAEPKELKLEEGKWYRLRNGWAGMCEENIDQFSRVSWPFSIRADPTQLKQMFYKANGQWHPISGVEDEFDAIEEVLPEPKELKLEEGKWYRLRNGWVGQAFKDDTTEETDTFPMGIIGEAGQTHWLTTKGRWLTNSNKEYSADAIEEVSIEAYLMELWQKGDRESIERRADIIKSLKLGLTVEAGKWYRTRGGHTVKLKPRVGYTGAYPFLYYLDGPWSVGGHGLHIGAGSPSEYDLVKEVPTPKAHGNGGKEMSVNEARILLKSASSKQIRDQFQVWSDEIKALGAPHQPRAQNKAYALPLQDTRICMPGMGSTEPKPYTLHTNKQNVSI